MATPPMPFAWNKAGTGSTRAAIKIVDTIGGIKRIGVPLVCMIVVTMIFKRKTVVHLVVVVVMPLKANPSARTSAAGHTCLMQFARLANGEATRPQVVTCLRLPFFVERHKNQLLESKNSKIEETWIAQWKDKVRQPTCTPGQVMQAYCKDMDIFANHLVDAMDWECWPVFKDNGIDNKRLGYGPS